MLHKFGWLFIVVALFSWIMETNVVVPALIGISMLVLHRMRAF